MHFYHNINLLDASSRSILIISFRTEYSKDDIFQVYLNKIYYSDGVTGIKAAAKYYFNKDLKDLNLAEEAYLAGLPQVPNNYNIYDHPKAAEDRKKHCFILNALS